MKRRGAPLQFEKAVTEFGPPSWTLFELLWLKFPVTRTGTNSLYTSPSEQNGDASELAAQAG